MKAYFLDLCEWVVTFVDTGGSKIDESQILMSEDGLSAIT